jgi:gluconate 2-dehydrogenase gamma chain
MSGRISRRGLLGWALSSVSGAAAAQNLPWRPNAADAPTAVHGRDYQFLHPDEAAFIEAAIDRLIPADEVGPGARQAGVALFIDRQLAGPYGHGERTFLQGPFAAGEQSQGWQMHAPAVVYRAAIPEIDAWCRSAHGAPFAGLDAAAQDGALRQLESGDAHLSGEVAAKPFFELLLQNTMEGYFADPLYGGNQGMAAWRMIGFPGARYDYRPWIGRPGERVALEPISLAPRPR